MNRRDTPLSVIRRVRKELIIVRNELTIDEKMEQELDKVINHLSNIIHERESG